MLVSALLFTVLIVSNCTICFVVLSLFCPRLHRARYDRMLRELLAVPWVVDDGFLAKNVYRGGMDDVVCHDTWDDVELYAQPPAYAALQRALLPRVVLRVVPTNYFDAADTNVPRCGVAYDAPVVLNRVSPMTYMFSTPMSTTGVTTLAVENGRLVRMASQNANETVELSVSQACSMRFLVAPTCSYSVEVLLGAHAHAGSS